MEIDPKNNDGSTPLHWSARKGDVEAVKMLLEAGANVHARAKHGSTPLHWAAYGGTFEAIKRKVEAIKILLEAGADVNAKDEDGDTPFEILEMKAMKEDAMMELLEEMAE